MSHPRYSSDEIAELGQGLFDRYIRDTLGERDRGKLLVVDIESGEYELDSDDVAAVKRAREKNPDAAFYVLRVGHSAAFRLGRRAASTGSVC